MGAGTLTARGAVMRQWGQASAEGGERVAALVSALVLAGRPLPLRAPREAPPRCRLECGRGRRHIARDEGRGGAPVGPVGLLTRSHAIVAQQGAGAKGLEAAVPEAAAVALGAVPAASERPGGEGEPENRWTCASGSVGPGPSLTRRQCSQGWRRSWSSSRRLWEGKEC